MNVWTIKKSSQSYRFLQRYYFNLVRWPDSLNNFCAYYRKLVFTVLWTFLGGLGFSMGLGCLIFGPRGLDMISTLPFPDYPLISFPLTILAVLSTGLICLAIIAAILFGIGYGIYSAYEYAQDKEWIKFPERSEKPSVIGTWYKSYKSKYCPLVEIVE